MGSAFVLRLEYRSDRPLAGYEVHDERDDSEDDEQVNQKTADVQDKKSAQPENNEHHSQYKKHAEPSFFS
jgi:hypothetical protein